MTLLLSASALEQRRQIARASLSSLADSLASDLAPLLGADIALPAEKARLTRKGGRCPSDGTLLSFDPYSPRAHRCERCGSVFHDDEHYRWWIMSYQLWVAERAVHAAALHAVRGDAAHAALARRVLDACAAAYLAYPERDSVLGPSRPFFSTYLESIWLLQLCVAADLLERCGVQGETTSRLREAVVEPSARLVASFDEGTSNRQVWNDAALLAAGRLLGDARLVDAAVRGSSGLVGQLQHSLLADGTWYEGENYHLFAHRGLWYGVVMCEAMGLELPEPLVRKFEEGFATPFVTALPDFTFPSRRDSQYAVSLRQWRFAELAELGLARRPDDRRLAAALAVLYDGATPRRETGRATSAAEAERNAPASALGRSDLGWRSLLLARPTLPPLSAASPTSVLLEGQGLAILRRDRGRVYAALDYGVSGGGHGHPDRLGVLLTTGDTRWLDDPGTGSYVERTLHWYRSTLAHNAPLVGGASQQRTDGRLLAYEDRGAVGWVEAAAEIAPTVHAVRTIVLAPTYLVDELRWSAPRGVRIDLPYHIDGEIETRASIVRWSSFEPTGGTGTEDGFDFLSSPEACAPATSHELRLRAPDGSVGRLFVHSDAPIVLWRATAPGPPGIAPRRFHVARVESASSRIRAVIDWSGSVSTVEWETDGPAVTLESGERHAHRRVDHGWHLELHANGARSSIDLEGRRTLADADHDAGDGGSRERASTGSAQPHVVPRAPPASPQDPLAPIGPDALTFELAEGEYRRSETTWREAGSPRATVRLAVRGEQLVIEVNVVKRAAHFAARGAANELDNEPADINSDGVQVHLRATPSAPQLDWLIVPEPPSEVRVGGRALDVPGAPRLEASATASATGWRVVCAMPVEGVLAAGVPFRLAVVVNDMSSDRERRRGQLVLGAPGRFVYLRGDRHAADDSFSFVIADE